MANRLKINHWLGLYFLLSAACVARGLLRSVQRGLPLIAEATRLATVPAVKWFLLLIWLSAVLLLMAALLTGIGMMRAKRWARWLGLSFVQVMLAMTLTWALIFGVAPTGAQLVSSVVWMVLYWCLWKSPRVDKVFGRDIKVDKGGWVTIACYCLLPVVNLGAVQFIKGRYHISEVQQQIVYPVNSRMEPGFVRREVLDFRVAMPSDARVEGVTKGAGQYAPPSIVLLLADDVGRVVIGPGALGSWTEPSINRLVGVTTPYEIHRHLLRSRWSPVFLLLRATTIHKDAQLTSLETPTWKGFGEYYDKAAQGNSGIRLSYSIYSSREPRRSATYGWLLKARSPQLSTIEQAMGAFEFLPSQRTAEEYVAKARQARMKGHPFDAQFALTQAYLLGTKNPVVTLELAQVSAELGSWSFVKRLSEELLKDNSEDLQAKELFGKALKAIERSKGDSVGPS